MDTPLCRLCGKQAHILWSLTRNVQDQVVTDTSSFRGACVPPVSSLEMPQLAGSGIFEINVSNLVGDVVKTPKPTPLPLRMLS